MGIYDSLIPQPVATPSTATPGGSLSFDDLIPKTVTAPVKTSSGLYDDLIPKTTAPKVVGPSYWSGTINGTTFGPSQTLDTSGKPLLDYKLPGATATTTDKTRVDTTFDPSVAAPQTSSTFYNPRAVENRAQLKSQMGGTYSDELDHKIALELSGSNQPENLQIQPGLKGGAAAQSDTLETDLAKQVASGKMSLFDAQKTLAKAKSMPAPVIGDNTKSLWDNISNWWNSISTSQASTSSTKVPSLVANPDNQLGNTKPLSIPSEITGAISNIPQIPLSKPVSNAPQVKVDYWDLLNMIPQAAAQFVVNPVISAVSSLKEAVTGTPLPEIKTPAFGPERGPEFAPEDRSRGNILDTQSTKQYYMGQINAGVPEEDAYWNSVLKTVTDMSIFVPTVRDITKTLVMAEAPNLLLNKTISQISKEDVMDYLTGRKTAVDINLPDQAKKALADVFENGTREQKIKMLGGMDVLDVKPSNFGKILGVSTEDAQKILDSMGGKVRPSAVGALPGTATVGEPQPKFGMSVQPVENVGYGDNVPERQFTYNQLKDGGTNKALTPSEVPIIQTAYNALMKAGETAMANDLLNYPSASVANKMQDYLKSKTSPSTTAQNTNTSSRIIEPSIPQSEQEAKKYKSAEEFVKAQPTYYRGGRTLDISKIDEQGLPLTRDKSVAETFANEKNKFAESPAGKIMNIGKSGLEEHYIDSSAKIAQKSDIPKEIYDAYKKADPLLHPDKAEPIINRWAKENGFDAIDYSTLGEQSAKEAEVKVLNPDVLKTKSQLTDIWNKAHKPEPKSKFQQLKDYVNSLPNKKGGFINFGADMSPEEEEYRKELERDLSEYKGKSTLQDLTDKIISGDLKIRVGATMKTEARQALGGNYMRFFTKNKNASSLDEIVQIARDAGEDVTVDSLLQNINDTIAKRQAQKAESLRSNLEKRQATETNGQGKSVQPSQVKEETQSQMRSQLETELSNGMKPPTVPPITDIQENTSLPNDTTKFKYVKDDPIDVRLGKDDKATANGLRAEYVKSKNTQIIRGNHLRDQIQKAVPDKLEREGMFWNKAAKGDTSIIEEAINNKLFAEYKPQLEKALDLSPKAKAMLKEINQYYNEAGSVSLKNGVIHNVREDYQNRIYQPEPKEDFIKTELKARLKQTTRHAKARVFDTEFDAINAGKKFATTDISDALSIHNEEMARVNSARKLADTMAEHKIGAWKRPDNIPEGWKKVDDLQKNTPIKNESGKAMLDPSGNQYVSRSVYTAPAGIEKGLRAITDPDFLKKIDGLRGIEKYQGLVKTFDLAFSLFHHLTMATQTLYNLDLNVFTRLPKVLSTLNSPEFEKMEQNFIAHGGMTTKVEETQDIMRDLVTHDGDFYSKISNLPVVKQVMGGIHASSQFLFGKIQRYMKVMDYTNKATSWMTSHTDATNDEVTKQLRSIAKNTNAQFGGINWETMGITKSTRSILRIFLLAPDWVISNLSAGFKYPFEKSAGGKYARIALFLGVLGGLAINEALNRALSGHSMADNPTGHKLEVEIAPGVYASMVRGAPGEVLKIVSNIQESGLQGASRYAEGKLNVAPRLIVGMLSGINYSGQSIYSGKTALSKSLGAVNFAAQTALPAPFSLSSLVNSFWNYYFNQGSQPTALGTAALVTGLGRFSVPNPIAEATKAKATATETFRPQYDAIQELIKAGKTDEAQKAVDSLSEDDYAHYKALRTADKTKATQTSEKAMVTTVMKVQDLMKAGKTDEAQKIVDGLSDEDYRIYGLTKKKLNIK